MNAYLEKTKRLLIELALGRYNEQFQTKYVPEDFDIVTIEHVQYEYAFEIFTIKDNDSFRLRLYLKPSLYTNISLFRLYEQNSGWIGNGDEVYVSYGTIGDEFFAATNNAVKRLIKFGSASTEKLAILLCENGLPLVLEDNSYIYLEQAVAGGLYPR